MSNFSVGELICAVDSVTTYVLMVSHFLSPVWTSPGRQSLRPTAYSAPQLVSATGLPPHKPKPNPVCPSGSFHLGIPHSLRRMGQRPGGLSWLPVAQVQVSPKSPPVETPMASPCSHRRLPPL